MKSKNNYHAPANISCDAKYLKELVAEWQEGCRTSISYIFFFLFYTFRFWISYNWHLRECQQPSRFSHLCTCHTWLPPHGCIYASIQSCHCWTFDVLCRLLLLLHLALFVPQLRAIFCCYPYVSIVWLVIDPLLCDFCDFFRFLVFVVILFFFFCLFVCCCRCRFKYG